MGLLLVSSRRLYSIYVRAAWERVFLPILVRGLSRLVRVYLDGLALHVSGRQLSQDPILLYILVRDYNTIKQEEVR